MLQRAGAWRLEKGGDAAYVSVRSQVHAASTSVWSLRAPRCAVGAGGGAARRRRALAGALRYGRVRVEEERGERGGGLSVPQQPRARPPVSANGRAGRCHVLAAAAAAEAETGAASATRAAAAAAAAAGLRSRRRGRTRWRRRRSGSGDRARAERGGAGRLRRWGRRLRGGPSRAGGGLGGG